MGSEDPARDDLSALVTEAIESLLGPRHRIADAVEQVPNEPGLYAVYGANKVWTELGLEPRPDRPLYVGKAERSLAARDIRTHFASGKTGSSTVRRSFAALLRDRLGLSGVPRNQEAPERPSNFGLEPAGDEKLTKWMHERLLLATWSKPTTEVRLDEGG